MQIGVQTNFTMDNGFREYFTISVSAGAEEMLEPPTNCNVVLTQVSLAGSAAIASDRAKLCGSIELMRPDKPKVDGEYDADDRDFTIASFFPGGPATHRLNLAFSPMEICYLSAVGCDMLVSGYTVQTTQRFTRFEEGNL